MYNTDLPSRADLPSSARLLRSTIIAAVGAAAILVTVVLPADYGIDPTGAGRLLGLTDMGETKTRLATEAEEDRKATLEIAEVMASGATAAKSDTTELVQRIASLERSVQELVRLSASRPQADAGTLTTEDQIAAAAANVATEESPAEPAAIPESVQKTEIAAVAATEPDLKSDSVSVSLAPGEGAEIKLVMKKGAKANFGWATEGGPVNFDQLREGQRRRRR
jgi:hypothetical protein